MKNKNYFLAILLISVCISSLMAQRNRALSGERVPGRLMIVFQNHVTDYEIDDFIQLHSQYELQFKELFLPNYHRNMVFTFNETLLHDEDEWMESIRQDERVYIAQYVNILEHMGINEGGLRLPINPIDEPLDPEESVKNIPFPEFIPNDAFFEDLWNLHNSGQIAMGALFLAECSPKSLMRRNVSSVERNICTMLHLVGMLQIVPIDWLHPYGMRFCGFTSFST